MANKTKKWVSAVVTFVVVALLSTLAMHGLGKNDPEYAVLVVATALAFAVVVYFRTAD